MRALQNLAGITTLLLGVSASLAQSAPGHFGRGLHLHNLQAHAPVNPVYNVLPITVECWAKIKSKDAQTVLLSNEFRTSGTHWEIRAEKGTGAFAAFLPSYRPTEIKSTRDIADDQWHYLAMVFDGQIAKLYVDGQEVAGQKVEKVFMYPDSSPLTIGHAIGVPGTEGSYIDEIRLSRIARTIDKVPTAPFAADDDTIALWHLDDNNGKTLADASRSGNAILLEPPPHKTEMVGQSTRWQEMDFGPFFTSTLGSRDPKAGLTHKAISIRVGKNKNAAIAFDTDLLRVSAAWTGDFVKIYPGREGLAQHPDIAGKVMFTTLPEPGFSRPVKPKSDRVFIDSNIPEGLDNFADPRPGKVGPLPADHGRYKGLYVCGDRVVLAYSVGSSNVVETHDLEKHDGIEAFARTIEVEDMGRESLGLMVRVLDAPDAKGFTNQESIITKSSITGPDANGVSHGQVSSRRDVGVAVIEREREVVAAALVGDDTATAKWKMDRGVLRLRLPPPSGRDSHHKILIWSGAKSDIAKFEAFVATSPKPLSLATFTRGGRAQYPDSVITKGTPGTSSGAYVVDTLTAPDDNPWKSFLRFSGLDFFSNGDLVVCSISGDVWVVSNIDDKLQNLKWRRFATGLHQPLGLKVVDDNVYVLGRDQITRLHDLNGDGEADFYENFNNEIKVTENGHEYTTCLETDPAGNFYFLKCGNNTEHGGTVLRVLKDGSKLEVFATGLRNPNGLGASLDGMITEADNQGEWVPASRIDLVKQGAFLGYVPMAHTPTTPTDPGKPICWMPQNVDNSSGGQVFVSGDKWGPFKGEMLHTSYGAATLLHVMHETVNGQIQGGVYTFPLRFDSGIMRGRFSPKDGQLYVCGLKGWQTAGTRDGVLQRVRYTGKNVYMPASLHVHQNGIRLSFTSPLDPETANDVESYSILQWNYRWTKNYGSPHYSVANPDKQGYDTVEIKSARLLPDKKTVFLEIPSIRPVMQMQIQYNLISADGQRMKGDVHNTIHELAPGFALPSADATGASPALALAAAAAPTFDAKPRKIVLVAGKKSHGPGEHEYQKSCELLKQCLDSSPNIKNIRTEVILNGWPEDPRVLEDADTILLYCDGSDRDEKAHPLLTGDRLAQLGKLMDRGVGLICVHYAVFVPTDRGGRQFQDWIGGYFDYDSAGRPQDRSTWYSTLGTATTTSTLVSSTHPITRGVKPFTTKTEYYWKIHFRDIDPRLTPLLTFNPQASGTEAVVAWAVERKDGGRAFGFTEGHYYSNWQIDSFRKLILNALLWTAHAEVPEGGVESTPK